MKISLVMFESLLAELAEKMALPPEVSSLYAFTRTQRVRLVWFVQITAAAQIQPQKFTFARLYNLFRRNLVFACRPLVCIPRKKWFEMVYVISKTASSSNTI